MESLKILIPTDFSAQAGFAYQMVKKLGERIPIEVHFIHVMDVPDTVYLDENGNLQTCGEIDIRYLSGIKAIADRKLLELRQIHGSAIQSHLVLGKITDSILDFATTHQFHLIAMGTKGAWGVKEVVSGSETQMIARKSSIPVLSVMCDRSALDIRDLLFVHDFSDPVTEEFDLIRTIISAFNLKVHLLQITSGTVLEEKVVLESRMGEFAKLNDINKFECHVIHDTDIEAGVVHFDQVNHMDIICIGTHGTGSIFHHSATEKLINHLFKPIISFHLKQQS